MYEHTINVPLIIAGPGIEAGSRTDAQVYLREIYPTTCQLSGILIPAKVSAEGFADVLKGEKEQQHKSIFGFFTQTQRMIRRDDGWKLIYYPELDKRQLFNVKLDPNELHDLDGQIEYSDIENSLEKELTTWRKQQGDPLLEKK